MSRHLETRVVIHAPIATVWSVLADTDRYPEWNDVLAFRGNPREGESLPMTVRLFGFPLTLKAQFERIEEPHELRWRGGPTGLFAGTHYLRLRPTSDDRTELLHGEDFHGLAVPILFPLLRRRTITLYSRINAGLKQRAESLRTSGN